MEENTSHLTSRNEGEQEDPTETDASPIETTKTAATREVVEVDDVPDKQTRETLSDKNEQASGLFSPISKPKRKFTVKGSKPAYTPSYQRRPTVPYTGSSVRTSYSGEQACDLYIRSSAFEKIREHIVWGKHTPENLIEQGGILLGHAFLDENHVIYGVVEDIIAGQLARGSPAYLEVSHATWKAMFDLVDAQYTHAHILGWYHTHPGVLDIFMSGTDRNTQRRLFGNDWQFALVLNPQRLIWKVFRGAGVRECGGCEIDGDSNLSDH